MSIVPHDSNYVLWVLRLNLSTLSNNTKDQFLGARGRGAAGGGGKGTWWRKWERGGGEPVHQCYWVKLHVTWPPFNNVLCRDHLCCSNTLLTSGNAFKEAKQIAALQRFYLQQQKLTLGT